MPSENQQVLRLRLVYLMRRFLSLALGMGFLLPTAARTESVWLVINNSWGYNSFGSGFEKIEMKDMAQCLKQGEIYKSTELKDENTNSQGMRFGARSFICLEGK